MSADDLDGILAFLRAAERLKTVTRSGWTSTGQPESVAEHTWRLCLMAMLLYGRAPGVDLARLLRMCLIHDLGEAIRGDVPAPAQAAPGAKSADERADLLELTAPLPTACARRSWPCGTSTRPPSSAEARARQGARQARDHPAAHPGHESVRFRLRLQPRLRPPVHRGRPGARGAARPVRRGHSPPRRRRPAETHDGPYRAPPGGESRGSHNRVGMADLRACLERQGFEGVRTLLQSGNVVFGGGRLRGAALERRLEETARTALGLDTPVHRPDERTSGTRWSPPTRSPGRPRTIPGICSCSVSRTRPRPAPRAGSVRGEGSRAGSGGRPAGVPRLS